MIHADEKKTPNPDNPYDCQSCGACCLGDPGGGEGYVSLTAGDQQRLQRFGLPLVELRGQVTLGTVAHDGPGGDRICVAFAGTVGKDCSCTLYKDQPKACRNFEVGGALCQLARHLAGMGPAPEEYRALLRSLARHQERTATQPPHHRGNGARRPLAEILGGK
jgi:Fe-S-cluster containining protein